MKKRLITLLVSTAITLVGCGGGGGGTSGDDTVPKRPETQIKFDLFAANKVLVTPSFIAMDQSDGTLAADGFNGSADYSTNINDPAVAIGKMDGWGLSVPIDIAFEGKDLDPASASAGFVIIEAFNPTTGVAGTTRVLEEGRDYAVSTVGKKLLVNFLMPLQPASNYMFAVTDQLKDVNGKAVGASVSYEKLKSNDNAPNEEFAAIQKVTHAVEQTISQASGTNSKDIIFSTWFETESAGNSLHAVKVATYRTIQAKLSGQDVAGIWGVEDNANITVEDLFEITEPTKQNPTDIVSPGTKPDQIALLPTLYAATQVEIYKGTVTLPYFLDNPSDAGTSPDGQLDHPWQSATPSLRKIAIALAQGDDNAAAIQQQLIGYGISESEMAQLLSNPAAQASVLAKLTGKTLTLADGSTPLDSERLVTRYSPMPQLRSTQQVSYLLWMPSTTNSLCPAGSTVPVNLIIHGFGRFSSDAVMYGLQTINSGAVIPPAGNCQAILAIDLPKHSSRHAAGIDPTDDKQVMYSYLSLDSLLVSRDNLRQSAIDQVSLRAAVGLALSDSRLHPDGSPLSRLTLQQQDDATTPGVGIVGVSLGGITGINYVAAADRPINSDDLAGDTVEGDLANSLFQVSRAHFDVPGGGIVPLLLNSPELGDIVVEGLLASEGYTAFEATNCTGIATDICHRVFFQAFGYAAQTMLDGTDPVNHISEITTPSLLTMVQNDQVVPNDTLVADSYLPSALGGTLPLLKAGNYTQLTGSEGAAFTPEGPHIALAGLYDNTVHTTYHGDLMAPVFKEDGSINEVVISKLVLSTHWLTEGKIDVDGQFLYQVEQ
ncbi:Pla-1/cef family extracellular lipase [Sinobacterium caligoides]|uniref:Pla-1/cef family extracellular lipase n=1 Tax=Sinobacterium caligoides TaxID=933926 RepID=A0A3N2DKB3_9GAMM|nr:hypothetical protein [Sinobacterium caligoides]ROS00244.1 Pla-1/cef family extracellular lipase [Sinobacterium caligoides]